MPMMVELMSFAMMYVYAITILRENDSVRHMNSNMGESNSVIAMAQASDYVAT